MRTGWADQHCNLLIMGQKMTNGHGAKHVDAAGEGKEWRLLLHTVLTPIDSKTAHDRKKMNKIHLNGLGPRSVYN